MSEERKATVSPNAIALPPNVRPNVPHDVDHCPACGSGELDVRPAVVSPFFAEYLFGGQSGLCGIAQCRHCMLMFFSCRLDRGEVARLYAGYRGEEYFRARHKHEFWYTRAFNDRLGEEADIRGRRELLYAAIGRHRDLGSIGSALDYGGDRGQILAQGPGRRRYVFDVSAAEPVEGVKRLRDEAELAGLDVDLLLLCEVLEHASAPVELLRKLASCLRPGGLLFVTVPYEQVPIADIPSAPWYRAYLRVLVKWKPLLTLGDFYSTAFRVKFCRIPPFGFAKMHEHLNFFSAKSLGLALSRGGFDVLECGLASPAGPLVAVAARRA